MAIQADTAVTTIPSPKATPGVMYIPEIRLGNGNIIPELRTGDTAFATIVADIASAQHDEVLRVIAVDVGAGKSWDASKEVAGAVLDTILGDYSNIPGWCIDFLEQHLGVRYVNECVREAA